MDSTCIPLIGQLFASLREGDFEKFCKTTGRNPSSVAKTIFSLAKGHFRDIEAVLEYSADVEYGRRCCFSAILPADAQGTKLIVDVEKSDAGGWVVTDMAWVPLHGENLLLFGDSDKSEYLFGFSSGPPPITEKSVAAAGRSSTRVGGARAGSGGDIAEDMRANAGSEASAAREPLPAAVSYGSAFSSALDAVAKKGRERPGAPAPASGQASGRASGRESGPDLGKYSIFNDDADDRAVDGFGELRGIGLDETDEIDGADGLSGVGAGKQKAKKRWRRIRIALLAGVACVIAAMAITTYLDKSLPDPDKAAGSAASTGEARGDEAQGTAGAGTGAGASADAGANTGAGAGVDTLDGDGSGDAVVGESGSSTASAADISGVAAADAANRSVNGEPSGDDAASKGVVSSAKGAAIKERQPLQTEADAKKAAALAAKTAGKAGLGVDDDDVDDLDLDGKTSGEADVVASDSGSDRSKNAATSTAISTKVPSSTKSTRTRAYRTTKASSSPKATTAAKPTQQTSLSTSTPLTTTSSEFRPHTSSTVSAVDGSGAAPPLAQPPSITDIDVDALGGGWSTSLLSDDASSGDERPLTPPELPF